MLKDFVSVNDLKIPSTALYHSIRKAGYETVGDIVNGFLSGEIYNVRGIGQKNVKKLMECLKVSRYEFGQFFMLRINNNFYVENERFLLCQLTDINDKFSIEFMMRKKLNKSSFVLYQKHGTTFPCDEDIIVKTINNLLYNLYNEDNGLKNRREVLFPVLSVKGIGIVDE